VPDVRIVRIVRSATKELESLPQKVVDRIVAKIDALTQQPQPAGCKKLQGSDDLWRVRVGDYRIIYAIHDTKNVVEIRVIRHRKDARRAKSSSFVTMHQPPAIANCQSSPTSASRSPMSRHAIASSKSAVQNRVNDGGN